MELYIGDQFVQALKNFACGHPYGRVVLCPKCLKGTLLTGPSSTDRLTYDEHDPMPPYTQFRNPALHIGRCPGVFPKDGIHAVQSKEQVRVAEELSSWSRREARWDFPLFSADLLKRGGTAFVLLDQGAVRGYGVFTTKEFDDVGTRTYVEDLYTFPIYRGKGVAGGILDHALASLTFKMDLLPVSVPVRPAATHIIAHRARTRGSNIMCVSPRGYWTDTPDEFLSTYEKRDA